MPIVPDTIIGNRSTLLGRTKSGVQSYWQTADLGAMPQVGGLYQQLFSNNPYRNLHYNKSSWQNFLSKLGFRTDADRWEEQVQENAAQWDAGVYQQMYQDEYNSELAKASRMKAAGENPDLLGTGSVAEAASPFQDPAGLDAGVTEEGVLGQITSGVISAFNSAFGMATQLMQLDAMSSDIEGKNISNASNMMNVIQQRVLGLTPAEGFKTDKDFQDWKSRTEATLRTNYGRSFFKGSALRRWNRSIDDFIGTLPSSKEQYKEWRERLGDAKSYLTGRESFWDEAVDVFKEINEWRFELQRAIEQNTESAKEIQSEVDVETKSNELEYQQMREPLQRARAENESNRRIAEGETYEGILNKHLADLGKRLDNMSGEGGFTGLLGEILIFMLMSKGHLSTNGNGLSLSVDPPSAS